MALYHRKKWHCITGKGGTIATGLSRIFKYKSFSRILKVLFFLILFSFWSDVLSFLVSTSGFFTAVVINSYTLIEGTLLLYYFALQGERKLFPWALFIFLSTALVEWIGFAKENQFLEFAVVVESCLLVIFALRFFARMLGEMKVGHLSNYPYFWVNCAVLVYFAACVFLFAFGNLIMDNGLLLLWHVHNFFHLIYLLLIAIAFWKVRSIKI
jgi:hypothetical protein